MLTCREIADLLDIYLDGELDAGRCAAVLGHLKQCPSCSELLSDRIRETEMILNSFPAPELTPGFKERVMANVASSASRSRFFPSLGYLLSRPWLAPALAGLILLVSVYGIYSHNTNLLTTPKQVVKQAEQMKTNSSVVHHEDVSKIQVGGYPDAASHTNSKTGPVPPERLLNGAGNKPETTPEGSRKGAEVSPQARSLLHGEPAQSNANGETTSIRDLLRAGYVVFIPTYLPPGYGQEKVVFAADAGENTAGNTAGNRETAKSTSHVQKPFAIIYTNPQTGSEINLKVVPTGPYDFNEPATATGFPGPDDRQPESEPSITWYAEKDGIHFILTLSGSLPLQELKKVADSIQ